MKKIDLMSQNSFKNHIVYPQNRKIWNFFILEVKVQEPTAILTQYQPLPFYKDADFKVSWEGENFYITIFEALSG